jgi:dipeptide/tripeptide permease
MKFRGFAFAGYTTVALGVLLGGLGSVRVGAVLIAVGAAALAISSRKERAVERYLPLILALGLITMAIVLPGGR